MSAKMPLKHRKIAVMGFRSVGKSSLTIQYVDGLFVDAYDPTIENTFQKHVKIRGQEYCLQLVDTAGQDEFSVFSSNYTMNIDGYVLVYSVNSEKSWEMVKFIHEKLLDLKGMNVPLVLVGNKTDLRMERVVSTEEGKKVADAWSASFLETSAKENKCVPEIFQALVMQIEKAEANSDKSGCVAS